MVKVKNSFAEFNTHKPYGSSHSIRIELPAMITLSTRLNLPVLRQAHHQCNQQ
jgi:hypothetical protein